MQHFGATFCRSRPDPAVAGWTCHRAKVRARNHSMIRLSFHIRFARGRTGSIVVQLGGMIQRMSADRWRAVGPAHTHHPLTVRYSCTSYRQSAVYHRQGVVCVYLLRDTRCVAPSLPCPTPLRSALGEASVCRPQQAAAYGRQLQLLR